MARQLKVKNVDPKDAVGYAKRAAEKFGDALLLNAAKGSRHSVEQLLVMACVHASDAICIAMLGQKSQSDDHRQAVDLLGRVERAKDLAPKLQIALKMKSDDQYSVNQLSASDLTRLLRIAEAMVTRAKEICGVS